MNREAKKLLAVNCLYAVIPLLLMLIPLLFSGVEMEAYGPGYVLYMVGVEAGIIAVPALLYFLTPLGRSSAQDVFSQKPTSAILLMVPLAFCAYFFVNGITACWMALLQALGLATVASNVAAPQGPAQLAAALFVIAAVPALCEEFFFRGVLLPSLLRRLRPGAAIVLGGCLFGLVHGDLSALPGHVLLGIGLCLVAYWTRSIWYVVVWHFLQNGIAVFITYFSGAMLEALGTAQSAAAAQEPAFLFLGGVLLLIPFSVGTALFLALLWITTRSHRSAPLPRAEGRAPVWVWAPVLVALLCAACLYALSGVQMAGGGL